MTEMELSSPITGSINSPPNRMLGTAVLGAHVCTDLYLAVHGGVYPNARRSLAINKLNVWAY